MIPNVYRQIEGQLLILSMLLPSHAALPFAFSFPLGKLLDVEDN